MRGTRAHERAVRAGASDVRADLRDNTTAARSGTRSDARVTRVRHARVNVGARVVMCRFKGCESWCKGRCKGKCKGRCTFASLVLCTLIPVLAPLTPQEVYKYLCSVLHPSPLAGSIWCHYLALSSIIWGHYLAPSVPLSGSIRCHYLDLSSTIWHYYSVPPSGVILGVK